MGGIFVFNICVYLFVLCHPGIIFDNPLFSRRYGLLGLNGCGKSTLMTALGKRELPIPEHMDIFHLTREIEASDMTALEAVVNCDEEKLKLEKEAEMLAAEVNIYHIFLQT